MGRSRHPGVRVCGANRVFVVGAQEGALEGIEHGVALGVTALGEVAAAARHLKHGGARARARVRRGGGAHAETRGSAQLLRRDPHGTLVILGRGCAEAGGGGNEAGGGGTEAGGGWAEVGATLDGASRSHAAGHHDGAAALRAINLVHPIEEQRVVLCTIVHVSKRGRAVKRSQPRVGQAAADTACRILAGEVERATRQQHRHVACPCARQEITHDARRGRAALAAARDATRDAALAALANPSTER